MDLVDGMRTFVAACEAGSFTAAADRLGMSKKLVSKYVGQLEDRLGARLLHRTTRTLSPTAAGQRLYVRAARLVDEVADIEADLREQDGALSGHLRLAAPTSFGELHLLPLLSEFRVRHPEVSVTLRLNDRYVDLAEEGVDLAVRIGRLEASSLIARRLGTTELWAVASPAYLARAGRPASPERLRDHACIRDLNFRAGRDWPFWVDGTERRVPVDGAFAVNSATATRALAIAGEGIALCPDYAVAGDVAEGRLERLLTDYPSSTLAIHAIWLDARHMPRRARVLVDFLADHGEEVRDLAPPAKPG